jgi:hypothetical protein
VTAAAAIGMFLRPDSVEAADHHPGGSASSDMEWARAEALGSRLDRWASSRLDGWANRDILATG